MMREIEQFYSTQIEEMPMFVYPTISLLLNSTLLTKIPFRRNVADLI